MPKDDVMTSLPSSRPQRRSTKRAPKTDQSRPANKPKRSAMAKPKSPNTQSRASKSSTTQRPSAVKPSEATRRATTKAPPAHRLPEGIEFVETAIQAAGELAHLSLTFGTKALRSAVSRLPKP